MSHGFIRKNTARLCEWSLYDEQHSQYPGHFRALRRPVHHPDLPPEFARTLCLPGWTALTAPGLCLHGDLDRGWSPGG